MEVETRELVDRMLAAIGAIAIDSDIDWAEIMLPDTGASSACQQRDFAIRCSGLGLSWTALLLREVAEARGLPLSSVIATFSEAVKAANKEEK